MPLSADDIAALTGLVGPGHVRTADDLRLLDPGIDPHNFGADLLLLPASTAEIAAILALCHARRIPVVPQGGRTGLSGGAVTHSGQVALSLTRLDRIEALDPMSRCVVAGAGVTLGTLAARAAEHGLAPGIDLGARDSATLGGLVSTNAGGVAAFRHGTMRERVLGLEAVLADGRVLGELGQVRKRNEGLAVERLLIGAEGTLGVITRVALALVPADGPVATALVALDSLEAGTMLADRVQASRGAVPTAIEVMSGSHAAAVCRALALDDMAPLAAAPYLVLVELAAADEATAEAALIEIVGTALETGLVRDALVAQNEQQRQTMWRVREDWAIDRERPGGLWYDVSVPLSALAAYVSRLSRRIAAHDPSLAVVVIGHLADGNLHVTVNAAEPITARYEEIAPLVTQDLVGLGGSFSAEHGIGLEKKATLARLGGAPKLALMRGVKALYDPHGIMNPGKVVPD